MKLDHETQKYLMMRNFYRLLKSPALILYALKAYEYLPGEYLTNSEDPVNSLNKIKEEFEDEILIDSQDAQKKALSSLRSPGFNLKIKEINEIPLWKKHFFDVLAVVLRHLFYEHYSKGSIEYSLKDIL